MTSATADMVVLKHKAGGGPTVLASDAFTRANGGLGANWTTFTDDVPTIVSNAVQDSGGGGTADASARYSGITWPDNQWSECVILTLSSASVGAGPSVRHSGSAVTYYRATVKGPMGSSAVIRIEKFLNGTYSALSSDITITAAANDVIRLEVTTSGSNAVLNAYQNDVLRVGPITDTTSAILTGSAGIAIYVDSGVSADAVLDTWQGGSL